MELGLSVQITWTLLYFDRLALGGMGLRGGVMVDDLINENTT